MQDFGKNFRKLRELGGFSQEALAASLNTSTSVVSRIENNKRKLDIDLIYKLQMVLALDICEMTRALFNDKFENTNLPDHHLSKHYEKIIDEKDKIIEEKNRYISQLERS